MITQIRPAVAPPRRPEPSRISWQPWAAVLTWLVALPVTFVLPSVFDLDPFGWRGAAMPVTVGGLLLCLVVPVGLRWGGGVLTGVAAGLFAGWAGLALRSFLHGTPFGFNGMVGDVGRIAVMANRYAADWASSDAFVAGVPSEYPPLFPWLIGRVSALTGVPAWRLVGDAEVATCSFAVLAAFLLWRRLVPGGVALALSAVMLVSFAEPWKPYETLAVWVFVPWALMAFGPRGRLHWAPAGAIGGLIVLTYPGPIICAGLGLLVLVGRDVKRALLVGGTAFAVSSWYVVPYLWAKPGSEPVQGFWLSEVMAATPFPFLTASPIALLQLVGLAGAVWLYRSAWWARPLLILLAGTYAFKFVTALGMVLTGNNYMTQYALMVISPLLAAMGVLTVVHVARVPRKVAALALLIAVTWGGMTLWNTWSPHPHRVDRPHWGATGLGWNQAAVAHVEQLPDGRYPRFAKHAELPMGPRLPVRDIRKAVSEVWGEQAQPVVLSHSERLFAYVPWPGYMGNDSGSSNSLVRWKSRFAEVRRLSLLRSPEEFAGTKTAFGQIDAFVLRGTGGSFRWTSCPEALGERCGEVRFSRSLFSPRHFAIRDLRDGTFLALRNK